MTQLDPSIISQAYAVKPINAADVLEQRQQLQLRNLGLARQQRQDEAQQAQLARQQTIGGLAAQGDYTGADQAALAAGDWDAHGHIAGLRDEHRKALANKIGAAAPLAFQAKQLPYEQRRQAIASQMPTLLANGWSQQEIESFDPTDANLDQLVASAQGLSDVIGRYDKSHEPYTLAEGAQRYDANNNLVAQGREPFHVVTTPEGGTSTVWGANGPTGPSVGPAPASGGSIPFDSLIHQESRGQQFSKGGGPLTSSAGAVGIAQVMPGTGPEAAAAAGVPWDANRFRTDAAYNRQLGEAYYNTLRQKYGDDVKAAAAYNAGPGRVDRALAQGGANWVKMLPAETRDYIQKVSAGQAPAQGRPQGTLTIRGAPKVDKAPAGYQWNADGTLKAIPGGPGDKQGRQANLKPPPNKALTDYQENQASLNNVNAALSLLDPGNNSKEAIAARNAIGVGTGSLGSMFTQLHDPAGNDFRAQLGRIGGIIIKDTSGAAVSASEDARLAQWVPKPNDTVEAARSKLRNLANAIANNNSAFNDIYNEDNGYRPITVRGGGAKATPARPSAPKPAAHPADIQSIMAKYGVR